MHFENRCVRGLRVAAFLLIAACTAPTTFASSDPMNAGAVVPPVQYRSPFYDYRSFGDSVRTPWRQANDEVARIGGWRTYLREAQQAREPAEAANATERAKSPPPVSANEKAPVTPPATASEPAAKPAPGGHAHRNRGSP